MKKVLSIIVYILLVTELSSQIDPEAKEILDKLSEKTKNMPAIEAKFNYKVKDKKEGSEYQNEGHIILKGDKYKLNLLGTVIYFDGRTMWNHLLEAEEVHITEPDEEEMEFFFSHPSKLFIIDESDFKISYVGESVENHTKIHDIDLYPIDLNNSYFRIKLNINEKKNELVSIKAFGKVGINYTVEIIEFNSKNNVNDSFFKFNKSEYPKIEIIDLRE